MSAGRSGPPEGPASTVARAVVAEDEPLLAEALVAELARAWPGLAVEQVAGDGETALAAILARRPDVVFLDIRMPGLTGLEVAEALAEDWPVDPGAALPLIVFVTAYDQHALDAFERAAVDYVLKPVLPERLALTCRRLESTLAERRRAAWKGTGGADEALRESALLDAVDRLAALLGNGGAAGAALREPEAREPLVVLQVGVGESILMVPVADVLLFEAADKYVRVLTAEREYLVRTSLRELAPRLDPNRFWQVHRGSIVRADAIAAAHRDAAGRVALALRGRPDRVAVSRLHAARFKAM